MLSSKDRISDNALMVAARSKRSPLSAEPMRKTSAGARWPVKRVKACVAFVSESSPDEVRYMFEASKEDLRARGMVWWPIMLWVRGGGVRWSCCCGAAALVLKAGGGGVESSKSVGLSDNTLARVRIGSSITAASSLFVVVESNATGFVFPAAAGERSTVSLTGDWYSTGDFFFELLLRVTLGISRLSWCWGLFTLEASFNCGGGWKGGGGGILKTDTRLLTDSLKLVLRWFTLRRLDCFPGAGVLIDGCITIGLTGLMVARTMRSSSSLLGSTFFTSDTTGYPNTIFCQPLPHVIRREKDLNE